MTETATSAFVLDSLMPEYRRYAIRTNSAVTQVLLKIDVNAWRRQRECIKANAEIKRRMQG